ncbi:ThuA domain-containing protein [Flavihumibacter petaseus]|uniref:ThuA-like domain-containing protein n=1 Tax=Flavihumibacter petaseus NBRC 106054 TaxID=1220578 RepID=A0A0E9MTY2_9BACT|nr:ThuA domain-containing protein [Flavihumibacter petaseus]GAO41024.1 hypothetical protein FPE01S_01_00360 [Flavihumibacter petaseus NBRC 106054]
MKTRRIFPVVILLLITISQLVAVFPASGQEQSKGKFHVLALYENGGHHLAFTNAAVPWLRQLAADSSFEIDFLTRTDSINIGMLSRYQLFFQLDFPPYGWKPEAATAFQQAIDSGKIGWIGLHHASLLGEFDGFPMWTWFWEFMGRIRFKDYIRDFSGGTVMVEDSAHPVMKHLGATFRIEQEEWYTYDKSPRQQVKVLARVDESSYIPPSPVRMGDHPVIWTNPAYPARNVYIFMGHSPGLFSDPAWQQLLRNAVNWAAGHN